jgi:hypothetical protein
MANHCANKIVFSGENLSLIRNLFDDIREENGKNYGWIPEGFSSEDTERFLFDVDITDNDTEIIFECWTKWNPPIDEMLYLCFGTDIKFFIEYEELGMWVFGKCFYDGASNTFNDISLNDLDFKRVGCNDYSEWTFNGDVIESRYDALEEMLEHKLKQIN